MWPERVIARVEGGLGNQMFQYAAARSLADRLGCDLALDLRGLHENGDREYMLDRYSIRATIASEADLMELPRWRPSRIRRVRSNLSQRYPRLFSFAAFWPKTFAYDPRFERISRPSYLIGYWQSEKYFAWNRPRILRDLSLLRPIEDSPLLDRVRNTMSVSLHIRRGDYVTNPDAAKFHGVCDMSYYERAIDALTNRFPDLEVFAFSDEPQWVLDHLRLPVPVHVVTDRPSCEAHIDLELMTNCRHHVIANSSFSWWGAWRCQSPGQIVYAPGRWFADEETDTSDVVPVHWIRLK